MHTTAACKACPEEAVLHSSGGLAEHFARMGKAWTQRVQLVDTCQVAGVSMKGAPCALVHRWCARSMLLRTITAYKPLKPLRVPFLSAPNSALLRRAQVGIVHDIRLQELRLFTDYGRCYRP